MNVYNKQNHEKNTQFTFEIRRPADTKMAARNKTTTTVSHKRKSTVYLYINVSSLAAIYTFFSEKLPKRDR